MPDRFAAFGNALVDSSVPIPVGIVGPDGLPSPKRFAVYRNNVAAGLIDALAAAYPAVERLVGRDFFRAMAREFSVRRLPASPILLHYGAGFADFIAAFAPARELPYLADVARVERAWTEAYHAAEAVPTTADELAKEISPDRFGDTVLFLHPSVRLLRSPYPALSIWNMNVAACVPQPIDIASGEDVLIARPYAEVEARALPAGGAFEFLSALDGGKKASAATSAALRVNPRFDLMASIAGLIMLGLVTDWRTEAAEDLDQ
jgi:hypothetical protein